MALSEKMSKMLTVIKSNDEKLRKHNDRYKRYFTPDIPDKIIKKLLKYYDNHLNINGTLAFFDDSLLGSSTSGIIFTSDGLYYKFMSKPVYIRYSSINNSYIDGSNIVLQVNSVDFDNYPIYCSLDTNALQNILEQLIIIDTQYGQTSFKGSGTVKKVDIPEDMMGKCHGIIHAASVACGGVGTGLAQIPLADNAVMVPIQIGMIVGLGTVFELHITESAAKSIIASAGASIAGRSVSQLLWGWIPVVGNAINTATAAVITEAIGWIAVANFYERWLDDKNKGRLEGMKDGYTAASGEYERKLRKQAEEFLKQIKDVRRERDEYEKLLADYEVYIKELEQNSATTELVKEMRALYAELKHLRTA